MHTNVYKFSLIANIFLRNQDVLKLLRFFYFKKIALSKLLRTLQPFYSKYSLHLEFPFMSCLLYFHEIC